MSDTAMADESEEREKKMMAIKSRFAPSRRGTSSQSNAISHWLAANLESNLQNDFPPVLRSPLLTPSTFSNIFTIDTYVINRDKIWIHFVRSKSHLQLHVDHTYHCHLFCNTLALRHEIYGVHFV